MKKSFNPEARWILASVLIILSLTAVTLGKPEAPKQPAATVAPTLSAPYPVGTETAPYPAVQEYPSNRDQTNGVIVASVILVMIILLGAFIGTRRKNNP